MAQIIVPERADISELPNDPTFPMACVIESSYVISGHGVNHENRLFNGLQESVFLGILNSCFTFIS